LLPVRKRSYTTIIVGLFGAALVGLLVYGVAAQAPSRTLDDSVARHLHPRAPSAGDLLPVLGSGGRRSLASYAGEVVVLNFWASWCTPCRREASVLERTEHKLLGHHGTVLGVTFRDSTPDSIGFMTRYRLSYPNLDDTTGEFARAYGTNEIPETFVIDRYGHVVAISRGEVNEPFLESAIARANNA
jgi:cytochrome c biogenesis protein CcmG/thiol:disulfide interchange protein DsbE